MGIYYLEAGANQRPSKVVYDRDSSSIALAGPGAIDLGCGLRGRGWFHLTGITPAISASAAELSLEALRQAAPPGDDFPRPELSQESVELGQAGRRSDAGTARLVDIVIANEEDVQMTLGIEAGVDVHSGKLDLAQYEGLTARF